jgi:hypothetical protein
MLGDRTDWIAFGDRLHQVISSAARSRGELPITVCGARGVIMVAADTQVTLEAQAGLVRRATLDIGIMYVPSITNPLRNHERIPP